MEYSPYQTVEEIHNRAIEGLGIPFKEMMLSNNIEEVKSNKATAGDAWEAWFKVPKNSVAGADLVEAGVELKATPYKQNKNSTYSAKERLVFNIINYEEELGKTFETSSFWLKNKLIELGFYEYNPKLPRDEWFFSHCALFTIPESDIEEIKNDWQIIQDYIAQGKAHEISEGLTNYLAACTKGANRNSIRRQPCSDIPAKQRAYSLKASYMTELLRNYILGTKVDEAIRLEPFDFPLRPDLIDEVVEYQHDKKVKQTSEKFVKGKQSFSEVLLGTFNKYIGMTLAELIQLFSLSESSSGNYSKAIIPMVVSRMLDIQNKIEDLEEIKKANIQIKTVRVQKNGRIKESMSFPAFNFEDLSRQNWENSDLREFFEVSRFLFIVFQENENEEYIFKGAKFWNMPISDLDNQVQEVWQDTVDILNTGVELYYNSTSKRVHNNFTKISDDKILSVRPHASKASYLENNPNADRLPVPAKWTNKPNHFSNQWMTKQCFWLNNNYIEEQISELID